MSQRNPLNERYTREENKGKTRKSAASAKPSTKAASSVRMKSTSDKGKRSKLFEKKSPQQEAQERKERATMKQQRDLALTAGSILMERDPTYMKLRRIWWIVLIVAIAATLVSWSIQFWLPTAPVSIIIGVLVLAYVAIIASLVLDLVKIRPIRNKFRSQAASMSRKAQEKLVLEHRMEIEARKATKKKATTEETSTQDSSEQHKSDSKK